MHECSQTQCRRPSPQHETRGVRSRASPPAILRRRNFRDICNMTLARQVPRQHSILPSPSRWPAAQRSELKLIFARLVSKPFRQWCILASFLLSVAFVFAGVSPSRSNLPRRLRPQRNTSSTTIITHTNATKTWNEEISLVIMAL